MEQQRSIFLNHWPDNWRHDQKLHDLNCARSHWFQFNSAQLNVWFKTCHYQRDIVLGCSYWHIINVLVTRRHNQSNVVRDQVVRHCDAKFYRKISNFIKFLGYLCQTVIKCWPYSYCQSWPWPWFRPLKVTFRLDFGFSWKAFDANQPLIRKPGLRLLQL